MVKPYHEMDDYERGRHGGHQDVYNALISMFLDAMEARRGTAAAWDPGQMEVLVWASMVTWGLDEEAAAERVAEDLQERMIARAD